MENCSIVDSGKSGVTLERVSGRLERSTIGGAAAYALYCVEGASMRIADNLISGAERAITGYRWSERVTGDLAMIDASGFPHLQIGKNLIS